MKLNEKVKSIAQWAIIAVFGFVGVRWVINVASPQSVVLPASEAAGGTLGRDLRLVTLLPKDAIPAIFDPQFLTAEEADGWYSPDELVLGVEIDGDARAYSVPYLSGREIVNDEVGGRKIAVTW
jgi:hypothetical protein